MKLYTSDVEIKLLFMLRYYNMMMDFYIHCGNSGKSEYYLKKSLECAKNLGLETSIAVANRLLSLAIIKKRNEDLKAASDNVDQAIKLYEHLCTFNNNFEKLSQAYTVNGNIYWEENDFIKAKLFYKKALEIDLKLHSDGYHFDIARDYNNLGGVENEIGDKEKALEYYLKAQDLFLKISGKKVIEVSLLYSNIAIVLKDLKTPSEGLHYALEAIEINEEILPELHEQKAFGYRAAGQCYMWSGDCKKALEYFKDSFNMYCQVYEEVHTRTAKALRDLAICHKMMGNNLLARRDFQGCLDLYIAIEKKHGIVLTYDKDEIIKHINNLEGKNGGYENVDS